MPKATGTSTQDAKDGKLAFDSAKFAEAMTADSNKVKDLFAAFSTGLDAFIKTQTGTSGVLDLRSKSADAEIKRIDEQVDARRGPHHRQGEAPQGPVRGHGGGAGAVADAGCLARRPDHPR